MICPNPTSNFSLKGRNVHEKKKKRTKNFMSDIQCQKHLCKPKFIHIKQNFTGLKELT